MCYTQSMRLGRPKAFDRTEALEKAMLLFWDKGYEAASVRDLLAAMGINRGSMYDTFGDKRSLFLETIRYYCENVAGPALASLNAEGSPKANIERTLRELGDRAASNGCRGCFMTNTTVEVASRDPEVAKAMKSALLSVEEAFRQVLNRAVELSEVPRSASTRALARFLANTLQGLVVTAKGKLGKQTRDDVIEVAMAALSK